MRQLETRRPLWGARPMGNEEQPDKGAAGVRARETASLSLSISLRSIRLTRSARPFPPGTDSPPITSFTSITTSDNDRTRHPKGPSVHVIHGPVARAHKRLYGSRRRGGPFRDFAEADLGPSEVAASVPDQQLDLLRGRLLHWIARQLEFVAIG